MKELYEKAGEVIAAAKHILVIQADNPDGDSLASALALEAILLEQHKTVTLVCGIDMPAHLKYLEGWDRVQKDVPQAFDASIIVDASAITLFSTLENSNQLSWIKAKPTVVLDHHQTSDGLDFATVTINASAVATGEVIFNLATDRGYTIPLDAKNFIAVSIMSDSLGLTSEGTTVSSIRTIADLVEGGVSLAELDNARRNLMRREPELLPYKGALLQRVELHDNGRIATIVIPWKEIEQYSMLYNPSMLVMDDMRMTIGVGVAIAFKVYHNGCVTAKIRCNSGSHIADKIADYFGGGGHAYAAGFKKNDVANFEQFQNEVIDKTAQLLKDAANS
jgi:phosphoesterase RecJ-like protein